MRIVEQKVYTFEELSEEAQRKAIEKLYDINVDHDWWDSTLDEAKEMGIEISEFDCDHNTIKGKLLEDVEDVLLNIVSNIGKVCDLYKEATRWIEEIEKAKEKAKQDCDTDKYYVEDCIQDAIEDLTEEVEHDLLEEYLSILRREYDYLTGEEAIKDTILANEYEFTEDGVL